MDHINVRFQNVLQPILDRAQCEQRNARRFEFQQKIHVAVRTVCAIGIGTEQLCFLDRVFLRGKLYAIFDFLNIQYGTNSFLNSISIIPNPQIISSKTRYRITLRIFRASDIRNKRMLELVNETAVG